VSQPPKPTASAAKKPQSTAEAVESGSCPLDMSRILIMDFVSTLEHQAATQGSLDVGTLRDTAEGFLSRLRATTQAPDNCLKMHERMLWDERRRHAFERLVVLRFAHLLPKRSGDDGVRQGAQLSRRAIPGLAVAMTKMMGLDQYRSFEEKIRAQMQIYKLEHPGPVNWDHVANHPEFHGLVDQALLVMTGYFTDLEKRVPWLIEVINSHLAPPPPEDGRTLWIMDGGKTLLMLGALYADLRTQLASNQRTLERLYGPCAVQSLAALDTALYTFGIGPAGTPSTDTNAELRAE
jgi:hypothetical protein